MSSGWATPSIQTPSTALDSSSGSPFQITTAVDFAYYAVYPKAKSRLPQVKAFVAWLTAEAEAHETALRSIDNGAGI